jgi:hypothetical protein
MMIDDDTLKQLLRINDALFSYASGSPTSATSKLHLVLYPWWTTSPTF